ncbi:hypothetical protein NLX86_18615 [Streptomyces sp. A3M-1-3]|uniref:hypothetical protein n=1 Tax=Streptomyces sp. A3M-1-3 TaxID=2962044 RepID=UPI0020B7ACC3|nr:hypothetical protein [Streptomyces sp. A3M-1-3]MCP3820030.1 hypothetical protein [Streptomyces sp. A3M-1-3]
MNRAVPQDAASLKRLIEREISGLRAEARRWAGVWHADARPTVEAAPEAPAPACPCGQSEGPGHSCSDPGPEHDPWACLCATLPAIPVSAALLAPVRGEDGETVDFLIRAGNHVRSAQWLDAPDRQVGRRLPAVRPGAEASGLLDAFKGVLRTGRALKSLTVDNTEQWEGRLHRAQLLYDAASCGDRGDPAGDRAAGRGARGGRRGLVQVPAAAGRPDSGRHR